MSVDSAPNGALWLWPLLTGVPDASREHIPALSEPHSLASPMVGPPHWCAASAAAH